MCGGPLDESKWVLMPYMNHVVATLVTDLHNLIPERKNSHQIIHFLLRQQMSVMLIVP